MIIDSPDIPPLSPTAEQVAPADPAFAAQCLSMLDALDRLGPVRPGPVVLTISKTWGLVYRVDFTIDGESVAPLIDRFICWKAPGQDVRVTYAIGEDIAPLAGN
jgi:hypothetical protein